MEGYCSTIELSQEDEVRGIPLPTSFSVAEGDISVASGFLRVVWKQFVTSNATNAQNQRYFSSDISIVLEDLELMRYLSRGKMKKNILDDNISTLEDPRNESYKLHKELEVVETFNTKATQRRRKLFGPLIVSITIRGVGYLGG